MVALPSISGGGGESSWLFGWLLIASIIILVSPIAMITFLPERESGEWQTEIESVEETYFNMTGQKSTPSMNIWTLKGVYTPFNGTNVGYTDDGWVYGTQVRNVSPAQYSASEIAGISTSDLEIRQADNGLWYYVSAPSYRTDIVLATWESEGSHTITNPDKATVCSMVTFDNEYVSDTFFTTSTKSTNNDHYYYAFTGYRYVYGPFSDYYISMGGEPLKVNSTSTSLSLIWYKYSSYSGISGQLTISGSDSGLSYITAEDIVRAFNEHTYSATFDMQFNAVTMHIVIRLDPMFLQTNTISQVYDAGYWSVMVYSDAIAEDMISETYDLSAENILDTVLDIFTFNLAEEYDIDGWMGFLFSLFFSMVFYSVALVVCLHNAYLMIALVVVGLFQALLAVLEGGIGGIFG